MRAETRKRRWPAAFAGMTVLFAVLVGSVGLFTGIKIQAVMKRLDLASGTKMVDRFPKRLPTQEGYDIVLRVARDRAEREADLSDLVVSATRLVIMGGVAHLASAGMFAFAWFIRSRDSSS